MNKTIYINKKTVISQLKKYLIKIKYNNYSNFKHFITAFKKAIKKLANLNISLPEL